MEDDLKKNENGRQPKFVLKIKDNLNFFTLEDDLTFFKDERQRNFYLNGRRPKNNAILTNSIAQHRQPDQHNNNKYIGTNEKINLNWL
jgi:hypothetical protein